MNKLLQQVLSTTLAVSLAVSACPIGSQAANGVQSVNGLNRQKTTQSDTAAKEKNYVEGEVLIVTKNVTTSNASKKINAIAKEAKNLGIVIEDTKSFDAAKGSPVLQISKVTSDKYSTEELIKMYQKSPNVEMVQPNYKYYAMDIDQSSYQANLWGIDNQQQNAGTYDMDINSDSAKMKMAEGEAAKEKVVAVIDTGVDYTHPLLSSHIWNNPYPAYLSGEHGYDFANSDADPMDDNGHGSHCSGIISSVMNGDNIKLMALKFLDGGGYGETYDAISAYHYIYTAQRLGVNVVSVNNSWGGEIEEEDTLLANAIELVGKNGAISVCAAGNDSSDLDIFTTSPASIDSHYIVSVAAANEKGELAGFSNYGKTQVDVAAPGTDILSSVSYYNFNPSVYGKDSEGKQQLCSVYEEFNGNLVTPDTPQGYSFSNLNEDSIPYFTDTKDSKAEQQVLITEDEYFGVKENGTKSLQWTVKNAKAGVKYSLYLPYKQEASDTPVYCNMMLKTAGGEGSVIDFLGFEMIMGNEIEVYDTELMQSEEGDSYWNSLSSLLSSEFVGKANYWEQLSGYKDQKVNEAGERAICVDVSPSTDGEFTIYLDDFAVSKSNIKEEELGKTAYYNGTSMATPYVAGVVAALANAYPKEDSLERIARIKGAVNKTEGLQGKVVSNGILDLDKADQKAPTLKNITVNQKGQLEIAGYGFSSNPIVTVNGKEMAASVKNNQSILVDGTFYNQILDVQVNMGEYQLQDKCYFSQGKALNKVASYMNEGISDISIVNDGMFGYMISNDGMVWLFSEDSFEEPTMPEILPLCMGIAPEKIFDMKTDGTVSLSGSPVCLNSDIYAVAVKESIYTTEAALVKLDQETMMWTSVAALPDSYGDVSKRNKFYAYDDVTLAAYNGRLYLLGGFDRTKQQAVKDVYAYDVTKNQWNKSTEMPEGRFAAKALQAGDKLVVTLGGNGSQECPKNLIFDGKTWSVSKAALTLFQEEPERIYLDQEVSFPYYTADVSLVQGGLIYTGIQAERLGDIFTYQLKSDSYQSTGYSTVCIPGERAITSGTLGDKLYMVTSTNYAIDYSQSSINEEDLSMLFYTMDVKPGTYNVSGEEDYEAGMLIGVGDYLPGSDVLVGASAYEDYYLKSLKVNGKAIPVTNKTEATTTIQNISSDVNLQAEYGAYVSELELDNTNLTIAPGKSKKLKVTVLPARADNKALSFKSSNTKVVTVDAKGNIKANKNAAGKSAVVTVCAKDRKTVVAKCTIKVVKPVKIKKITLSTKNNTKKVKAGKTLNITAKINPAKADNTTLKWSSSNKKYATVKDGKVTAKKAGIGKTVTIKAQATDGSKVKATIQLKIVK
ncbi:MAG: S8 family serine peptidase [Lachnospiraceae bacterium]|nr:S8 family serine peptidase [Lachnospiraceae bacterium]